MNKNQRTNMKIIESIRNRRSIRRFKPDIVSRDVLEKLLEDCRWSPSASNTQPWELAILGGDILAKFKERLLARMTEEWDTTNLVFRNINPDIPFPERVDPYKKRALELRNRIDSHQFPHDMPGIEEKRQNYLLDGGLLWGAPAVIILYTNKSVCPKAILDIGLMAQTIALASLAYGLGTCMMTMPVQWPEIIRELCSISDDYLLGLGIAIGYPDMTAPINNFQRDREPLEAYTHWQGF